MTAKLKLVASDPCDVIRVVRCFKDATGQGLEYVVINGIIVAKMFNGKMIGCPEAGNSTEKTK